MIKKFISLCFFLLLVHAAGAQHINTDSLIKIAFAKAKEPVRQINRDSVINKLESEKSPTKRIRMIYDVLMMYGEIDPKSSFYYHKKLLDVVTKNHDEIGQAVCLGEMAYELAQNGESVESVKMLDKGLALAKKLGNNQVLGIIYNDQELNNATRGTRQRINVLKKALYYSTLAGDHLFESIDYINIGHMFSYLKEPDSARFYVMKSLEVSVKYNLFITDNLIDLGELQDRNEGCLKYFWAAARSPFASADPTTGVGVLSDLAKYYRAHSNLDSALFYGRKAYAVSQRASLVYQLKPLKFLSDMFEGVSTDSVQHYQLLYYQLRDKTYNAQQLIQADAIAFADQQREAELKEQENAYKQRLNLYMVIIVAVFLLVVALLMWRNVSRAKKANALLSKQKEQITNTLQELQDTQTQLIQSEKMASLGELTAGIAHEIQNPLNFVNNFSEVSVELVDELNEELDRADIEEAKAIAADLKQNLEKINHHGKRADGIVKGMLEHSRASTGQKEPADLNKLADEYLRLAYHGLRAKDKSFNAELITHFDPNLPLVKVIPQDIGRVFLNLFTNAFYAVQQKAKTAGPGYKPSIEIRTFTPPSGGWGAVVRDNGTGIPDAVKDKIMQPFYTTKPTGEGTGLGLSISYDIVVKGHGGTITVNNTPDGGAEFVITLPA